MKPQIYFYIPVRDEEATVGVLLYRLMQVMREVGLEYEVHLTLDGCTDDSAEVVEPYMKKMPLLVTQHEQPRGYGKCLGDAIRKVNGISQNPKRDFFMILDADFSFDPVVLKEMAPGIERNVTLYLPGRLSVPNNKLGWRKRFANRLACSAARRRGVKLPDKIDLLTTVKGARIQHLRRNLHSLGAITALPVDTPPAVAGAMFYGALSGNSKKTEFSEFREQKMSRRASRFSLVGVIRKLVFGKVLDGAVLRTEQNRGERRQDGDRRHVSDRSQREYQGNRPGGGSRRRGGRSRRGGRRSGDRPGAKTASVQQADKGATSGKGQESRSAADQGPRERKAGSGRPRRRRRSNKPRQGSSNPSIDKGSGN